MHMPVDVSQTFDGQSACASQRSHLFDTVLQTGAPGSQSALSTHSTHTPSGSLQTPVLHGSCALHASAASTDAQCGSFATSGLSHDSSFLILQPPSKTAPTIAIRIMDPPIAFIRTVPPSRRRPRRA